MTDDAMWREVRWLRRYCVGLTVALLALTVVAMTGQPRKAVFDTIEVQRINVVRADGKYAVVIANGERIPGNVMGGKEHASQDRQAGGLLFYNRDGDEAGGLIFDNVGRDSSLSAFGQLSVDRYGSDQVAALRYVEDARGWQAGLQVSHYPQNVLFEYHAARDSALQLPAAARDSALRVLRNRLVREGKFEIPRVFVGETGRDAVLVLRDTKGRARIRLTVDSTDVATMEFLDARGAVVRRFPEP